MDDTAQQIKIKAFKVILVGIQSVGKSSILSQLINSQFPTNYQATIGIDYHTYNIKNRDVSCSLQIWDTAGQQKFKSLTSTYYKNSNACVCVYDIMDKESLEKTDYYLEKALEENIPKQCVFLVGNKIDLGSQCKEQGIQKAKCYQIFHEQVSAKEGIGIAQLFNKVGEKLLGYYGKAITVNHVEIAPTIQLTQKKKNCEC